MKKYRFHDGLIDFMKNPTLWSEPETFVQDTYNPVRLITIYAIDTFNLRINKKLYHSKF